MKNSQGEELIIDTRCGLHCFNCMFKEKAGCGGCIATNGHPFHGECTLAACCQNRELFHCGLCSDFPCQLLHDYSFDPEHGDSPHGARIQQLREWDEAGS